MSYRPKFTTVSGSDFSASFGSKDVVFKSSGGESGNRDHAKLFNRDADDAHPLSSITGLSGELNVRPATALTNMDIAQLLQE